MPVSSQIADQLRSTNLDEFLTRNQQTDPETFLLHCKGNTNDWNRLLAEQLKIYPKASGKLPEFTQQRCWFTSKSYEQSSSETLAHFKASLFKGQRLLDLSGGLGVDDWAFSFRFTEVVSLDPDFILNELARENFRLLGRENIQRLNTRAEDYLSQLPSSERFDLIYLDADRRPGSGKRFLIEEGSPAFPTIQEACLRHSKSVLLKVSPLADLTYLKKALPGLKSLTVVGNKNEALEILCLLEPDFASEVEVSVAVVNDKGEAFLFPNAQIAFSRTHAIQLFFEAHPCLIKADLSLEYLQNWGLDPLSPGGILAWGEVTSIPDLGRSFEITHREKFSKGKFQEYLRKNKVTKVNITQRSFGQSVEEIRKTYKIKEGGEDYLFLYASMAGGKEWCHARKIKPGWDKS